MAVTSPHLCGMGGDLLAMVFPPAGEPVALSAIGRAGSGVDAHQLRAEGHRVMPLRKDLRTVPVPGAVDGWLALHSRWGRLPLAAVFAPAIELAEEGFVASIMLTLASHLVYHVAGAQELCPSGPLGLEEHVRLPSTARTLRAIVREGRQGFYQGGFGQALIEMGQGIFTAEDFAQSLARWDQPLRLRVWGHDLWTMPPPSQGYLTLGSAWIAEHCGIGPDAADPLWAHLVVEASRAAGHDRPAVLYDGADGPALLDEDRLARAAARIDPERAAPSDVGPAAVPAGDAAAIPRMGEGDTTHLCAVDADGLGISLTQSNALDLGRTSSSARPGSSCTTAASGSPWYPGTQPSWGRDAGRRTPSLPCWPRRPTVRSRTSSAPWEAMRSHRSSSRCWPGCCPAGRTRPRHSPGPASRWTPRQPVRSVCGGAMTCRCAWRRTLRTAGSTTYADGAIACGPSVRSTRPLSGAHRSSRLCGTATGSGAGTGIASTLSARPIPAAPAAAPPAADHLLGLRREGQLCSGHEHQR